MEENKRFLRFPVISHSAEFLVQGYLMRRNILTYKAPPNNESYDLICIHPNPRKTKKQIRVQVKSRYQTDSDRSVMIKEASFGAFDYLIVVFLNIGYFFSGETPPGEGRQEPEFYTFPLSFIKRHHDKRSSWEKLRTRNLRVERYKNESGFEFIANDLGIPYPSR